MILNHPVEVVVMLRNQKFAVIGGDLRQVHLAGLLALEQYNVSAVGFDREVEVSPKVQLCATAAEAVQQADYIILPLPCTVDGSTVNAPYAKTSIPVSEIFKAAKNTALILGGKFSAKILEEAKKYVVRLEDYYKREELAILNAIPTAEGAIQIAMEELPVTIHGTKCLVTGYGKTSKMLCHDLDALGAEVTACARKYADLAYMQTLGYKAVHISKLSDYIGRFDIVFNTVPAVILTEDILSKLKKDCLVIDLASKPGGVDFDTAGRLGIKTIWALSLPGKVAPITSGAIIKDTIINMITESESSGIS